MKALDGTIGRAGRRGRSAAPIGVALLAGLTVLPLVIGTGLLTDQTLRLASDISASSLRGTLDADGFSAAAGRP